MIPAHAVPWPTTSSGATASTSPPVAVALDGDAPTRRPPTAGCVALDAGVHDGDPQAARRARRRTPTRGPRGPTARGARGRRGGRRRTARSRRGGRRSPAERAGRRRAARGGRARRGSRSTRPTSPGAAARARATASASAHRPSSPSSSDRDRRPSIASSTSRDSSPARRRQRRAQQLAARPARPGSTGSRPSPGARTPTRARCRAARTRRRRGGRAPRARRSCRRRRPAGTARIERGTYPVPSAADRSKRGSAATSLTASGWPVVNTYPTMPSLEPIASPTAPSPGRPGRHADHEPVARRVVERDRRGLGVEQRDGRLGHRSEHGLAARAARGGRRPRHGPRPTRGPAAVGRRAARSSGQIVPTAARTLRRVLAPRAAPGGRSGAGPRPQFTAAGPSPRDAGQREGDSVTAVAEAPVRISPTAVFKKRDFVLMWVAQLVSTAGSSLTDLAAGIYVYSVRRARPSWSASR